MTGRLNKPSRSLLLWAISRRASVSFNRAKIGCDTVCAPICMPALAIASTCSARIIRSVGSRASASAATRSTTASRSSGGRYLVAFNNRSKDCRRAVIDDRSSCDTPASPRSLRSSEAWLHWRTAATAVSFHMRPPFRNPVAIKNVAHRPCLRRIGTARS